MRRAVPLIAAFAVLAPAADAGALVRDDDCIDPALRSGFVATRDRGAPYEVLARRADLPVANRIKAILVRARTWTKLRAAFGDPPPRFDGARLPAQIFVVPASEIGGDDGAVMPYCGRDESGGAVIASGLRGVDLAATVQHETFHVFQAAPSGPVVEGGWWTEATATWWEHTNVSRPDLELARDVEFLGKPELPLDIFTLDGPKRSHHYGAWRFVDFVVDELGGFGATANRFLANTFRRIGRGEDQTDAVVAGLAGSGLRALPDALGRFWGESVGGRIEGRRPVGRSDVIPAGVSTQVLGAEPLAAHVATLQPVGDVREITIEVVRPDPDTRVWTVADDRVEEWRSGDEMTYCVGSNSGLGAQWPVRGLRVAATNGRRSGSNAPELRIEASKEPCQEAGSPLNRTGCRPAPYWSPPRGYSGELVFADRLVEIVNRTGQWRSRITSAEGQPAVTEFARYSRLSECEARMLDGLNQVPARFIPWLRDAQARAEFEARYFMEYAGCLADAEAAARFGEFDPCLSEFPDHRSTFPGLAIRLRRLEEYLYRGPSRDYAAEATRCARERARARQRGRRGPQCMPDRPRIAGPIPV